MAPRLTGRGDDHAHAPPDSVDRLVDDWRRVRPDLDFDPVALVTRIGRVRSHLDAALDEVFAEFGLSAPSFAVLVTLSRLNEAGGVSQRRLAEELGLTSGTVSVRIDRLIERGLVARRADADDRRKGRITLTAAGRALFERAVPAHLANERRLLAGLTAPERVLLEGLLRKLLVEYEGSRPAPGTSARLGLTVAPAHVTMAMRRAVGLSAEPGLLVKTVVGDGAASAGGVRPGDVLMRAGRRALTSVSALFAALADAAPAGRLRLEVLRGAEAVRLTVRVEEQPVSGAAPAAVTAGRRAGDEHIV